MPHQLLLADDSVTIQRVIKLTFADEDVQVVTVGDGDQALEAIGKQPPDIVLADVAMPGRSGYDVAQHIRTSPHLAHIPVLLLTGAFEPVDEARASAVGCDGVLAKPFEPDLVVSRVKELLTKPRPAAEKPYAAARVAETVVGAKAVASDVSGPPAHSTDVDAYFNRLDEAFATLTLDQRSAVPAPAQPQPADPVAAFAWASVTPTPKPAVSAAASAASLSLDDVFASLVVAPKSAPAPASVPSPAPAPMPVPQASVAPVAPEAPPAATLTDEQLEHIVNRVLERLTTRLGNPAEIVANVAERVVREEIAQIKNRC